MTGRWLPDSDDYRKTCLAIAKDLKGFKKNKVYRKFINNDNRPRETAVAFYNYIKEHHPALISLLEIFCENDLVGDPTLYKIEGRMLSPGTLRFMKVLGEIMSLRVEINSIVEIGAGYGGQCKIIKSWWSNVHYTIIDIPESLAVSKAYLGNFATFIEPDNIPVKNYSLVISDYCISEMDKAGIEFYMDKVVRRCANGYFTCNRIGEVDHLIDLLKQTFIEVRIEPETPKTSRHENIIIYAVDNRYLRERQAHPEGTASPI